MKGFSVRTSSLVPQANSDHSTFFQAPDTSNKPVDIRVSSVHLSPQPRSSPVDLSPVDFSPVVMEYKGFQYYFKDTYEGKMGASSYYCCSKYESLLCPGRLIVRNQKVRVSKEHTCREKVTELQLERDVTEEMRQYLHDNCMTNRASSAQLWELARKKMREDFGDLGSLKLLPRNTGINLVNRLRKEATGGDVFRALETDHYRCVSADDKRNFVQFNMSIAMARSSEYRRTVAFGHPDLIRQMCQPGVTLFIDATFSVTPQPFSQTIIIMMYDKPHDYYVPCFYVLVDCKEHWTYWMVFQWIKVVLDLKCNPAVVVSDFEQALHCGIRDQFPSAYIVGCLFHWKQALRRKMLELRIPVDHVSKAMEKGFLDVLTVVPHDRIEKKAIPFVQTKLKGAINMTQHKGKWDKFWSYFKNTWLSLYPVSCWNISGMNNDGVPIINRTNNPLERYNRTLGDAFKSAHPDLLTFCEVVKEESLRYLTEMEDVRLLRRDPPAHAPEYVYPDVPSM
jgi:hypothetical protein